MSEVDSGRVASQTGSSPSGQAPTGLDAPRFDPSRDAESSTLKVSLKADSGYRSNVTARISLRQWALINLILSAEEGRVLLPILDQDGKLVGHANKRLGEFELVEAFVDDNGTAWLPPTAWAYYAVCTARDRDTSLAEDPQGVSGEAVVARAAGIAHA